MNLLLDTCTFLWIITGDEMLSNTAERVYCEEDNKVYLSTVSEWGPGAFKVTTLGGHSVMVNIWMGSKKVSGELRP